MKRGTMGGAAIGRSSGEVGRALRSTPTPTPTARRSTLTAAGWTVLVALVWVLLAAWRPSTTWHLAPVLLAGAAPWVVGQDLRGGDRSAIPRVVAAAVAGAAVSALVMWALWSGGLLAGPTVLGFPGPAIEAFTFAGVASVLALLLGGGPRPATPPDGMDGVARPDPGRRVRGCGRGGGQRLLPAERGAGGRARSR